ncbi:carboxypeptidase-like regulatory domain-containing protein, partial [Patulibacter sp.]|uniref:carboxypeptidase-like regulatory domain-containing protein n=1 Tax=Patulibacter sp. TaxID=1912859 RepID=UPI0027179B75
MAVAFLMGAPAVAAAAPATVSGTVRDAAGAPITTGDVCVTARTTSTSTLRFPVSARTGIDGRYALTNMAADSYVVSFQNCEGSGRSDVGQYFGSGRVPSRSTIVVLAEDDVRTGVDATLATGTTIGGTVRVEPDASPAARVCVGAGPAGAGNEGESFVGGSTRTAADGSYTIRGLLERTGGYVVSFQDCGSGKDLTPRYLGGGRRRADAQVVHPTVAAPVTGADTRLERGGVLSGRITGPDGGPVPAQVCVEVATDGGAPVVGDLATRGSATVSGDGYRITGLATGRYDLTAKDCGINRRQLPVDGGQVDVTAGASSAAADLVMRPGTSISGRLYTGPGTGSPRPSTCVTAVDPTTGEPVSGAGGAVSSADGSYVIGPIEPTRPYKVEFDTCRATSESPPVRVFYDGTSDLAAATLLSPTVARAAEGVDGHLTGPVPTGRMIITSGPAAGATSNATDARFAFRADGPYRGYECALDSGVYEACQSPFVVTDVSDGPHQFAVRAFGRPEPAATRSWTVLRTAPSSTARGLVERGDAFMSDPGAAPSASTPVTAAVTLPQAGEVTLTREASAAVGTDAYTVFGPQLVITARKQDGAAPVRGTVADPITVTFTIDAGALPAGSALERLSVLRDGEFVADCTGSAGSATPDPCIATRRTVDGGDAELRVLATGLSTWTLVERARPVAPPTGGGTGIDGGAGPTGGGGAGGGSQPGGAPPTGT